MKIKKVPKEHVAIKIRVETLKDMESIRHPGQSIDGIIRELMDTVNKERKAHKT